VRDLTAAAVARDPYADPARDDSARRRLAAHLRGALPDLFDRGHELKAKRLLGGLSYETWRLDAGETAAILRRQPAQGPLEPYDLRHEVAVMSDLRETAVPVPEILLFGDDPTILGGPFAVVQLIEGDIPTYATLPDLPGWEQRNARLPLAREFMRVLGAIQAVDWRAMSVAQEITPVMSTPPIIERIDRLERAVVDRAHNGDWEVPPAFIFAIRWLKENAPPITRQELVLTHGDFKVGNFIWRAPRIVAMLDWEAAWIGDPLQDLGYACQPLARERLPHLMSNLASLEDIVNLYEQHSGRGVDQQRLHYYVIYGLVFAHLSTVLSALMSLAEKGGDMRIGLAYRKLVRATLHLTQEIEGYEEGTGVL
jgi:aminoglycoside phosphotransferase (APT) family kinase protein